jgi:hypothetical protein
MQVDVKLLFALWNDQKITQPQICERLGITKAALFSLKRRYALPHRHFAGKGKKDDEENAPTPAEIEERKALIQASWSPEERRSRAVQKVGRWTPPAFNFNGRDCVFSG